MTKIARATERNIKRLSKLQPGDVVRIYKKSWNGEGRYYDGYDIATVGESGFTYKSTNGTHVTAWLHLVVKTEYGVTDKSIYLSNALQGEEFIGFTDEAQEELDRQRDVWRWEWSNYRIAIEIVEKNSSYLNVEGMLIDYGFVATSEKLELLLADMRERSLTNENWLPEVAHYEKLLEIQKQREVQAATKKHLTRKPTYTPTTPQEEFEKMVEAVLNSRASYTPTTQKESK